MLDAPRNHMDRIGRGLLDNAFRALYGPGQERGQADRYTRLLEDMASRFGNEPVVVASAPGRTELGGNHTDHNHGRVMAAAVHLDIVAVAAPCRGTVATIHSHGMREPIQVDVADLIPRESERGAPESLVRGVAAGLAAEGFAVGGFNACAHAILPMGTGLSSSAAFEVLAGLVFSHLYNSGEISDLVLARVAKRAENDFFGKPCGFMDQLAVAMRGVVHIDFQHPEAPRVEYIDRDFQESGYTLTVVDTGGSHAGLTPEYAAIPREMGEVAKALGRDWLRGATVEEVLAAAPGIWRRVGGRAVLRALHFIEEDERVAVQAEAFKQGDMDAFLRLAAASGDSSWRLLQNCSAASDVTEQRIPLALAVSERFLGGKGACRIHGGGFAGAIQAYVPEDRLSAYSDLMETFFGPGSVMALRVRKPDAPRVLPGGGATHDSP